MNLKTALYCMLSIRSILLQQAVDRLLGINFLREKTFKND